MIRNKLIAGILLWLPLIATVWVINFMIGLFDNIWSFIPKKFHPDVMFNYEIPGLSVLIALVIIYLTGLILSNYFGKKIVEYVGVSTGYDSGSAQLVSNDQTNDRGDCYQQTEF